MNLQAVEFTVCSFATNAAAEVGTEALQNYLLKIGVCCEAFPPALVHWMVSANGQLNGPEGEKTELMLGSTLGRLVASRSAF